MQFAFDRRTAVLVAAAACTAESNVNDADDADTAPTAAQRAFAAQSLAAASKPAGKHLPCSERRFALKTDIFATSRPSARSNSTVARDSLLLREVAQCMLRERAAATFVVCVLATAGSLGALAVVGSAATATHVRLQAILCSVASLVVCVLHCRVEALQHVPERGERLRVQQHVVQRAVQWAITVAMLTAVALLASDAPAVQLDGRVHLTYAILPTAAFASSALYSVCWHLSSQRALTNAHARFVINRRLVAAAVAVLVASGSGICCYMQLLQLAARAGDRVQALLLSWLCLWWPAYVLLPVLHTLSVLNSSLCCSSSGRRMLVGVLCSVCKHVCLEDAVDEDVPLVDYQYGVACYHKDETRRQLQLQLDGLAAIVDVGGLCVPTVLCAVAASA